MSKAIRSHPSTWRAHDEIFRIDVRAIWRYLLSEPASFWLLNIYMFFEYVRPQSIWTSLAVLPWSSLSLVGATVAMMVEGRMPRFRTPAGGLLVVFTAVLVASSIFALDPAAAYAGWIVYFNWVLLFILITNIITTEKRFFIFMLAFFLYCFKMSQHGFQAWVGSGFSFVAWGVSGAPGWFQNSGEFGIQMCIFLPLIVEFTLAVRHRVGKWTRWLIYFMPVTAAVSIIASSSRGALLGGAAVGLWWVIRSKKRIRALVAVAVVAAAVWAVLPAEQKDRFATAGEDNTSISRIDRWEAGLKMARDYPILGIGFNGWASYYGPLSHNIFIEAMSELGYTGLIAFIAMIIATFVVNYQTRRLLRRWTGSTRFLKHMAYGLDGALIGFLVSGFFVTVLYYPYFWVNLAMTAALHVTVRNEIRRTRLARARDTIWNVAPQTRQATG